MLPRENTIQPALHRHVQVIHSQVNASNTPMKTQQLLEILNNFSKDFCALYTFTTTNILNHDELLE